MPRCCPHASPAPAPCRGRPRAPDSRASLSAALGICGFLSAARRRLARSARRAERHLHTSPAARAFPAPRRALRKPLPLARFLKAALGCPRAPPPPPHPPGCHGSPGGRWTSRATGQIRDAGKASVRMDNSRSLPFPSGAPLLERAPVTPSGDCSQRWYKVDTIPPPSSLSTQLPLCSTSLPYLTLSVGEPGQPVVREVTREEGNAIWPAWRSCNILT